MQKPVTARVEALRCWMREHTLSAFIVPSTDPHASEYVPDRWKAREWITGFNGSAGTAVVTLTAAALWTDSRYWLAAEEQVAGTPFEVVRCSRNVATAAELAAWIASHATERPSDGVHLPRVGLDGWCNTAMSAEALRSALYDKGFGMETAFDPFAEIWAERPVVPGAPLEVQPMERAGRSVQDKLSCIRRSIAANGTDSIVVTQLDEIAWALNLRGKDVHCTPVFVAYLLVLPECAVLYVDTNKVTPEVAHHLHVNHVALRPYDAIDDDITACRAGDIDMSDCTFQMDPATANVAIAEAMDCSDSHKPVCLGDSPIPAMRAVKTQAEQDGLRAAHVRDGIAMVQFLRWLDETDKQAITEMSADRKLTSLRAGQPLFRDLSFDTIAGYGPHAAIVHYEATPETDVHLQPHGLLLLDSGAQYSDGTTDITRTIALGPLTDEECRDYTLVLKGHLRLAMARFPDGTTGTQLDVLARYAMWQDGKNYGHGTGHGVGAYLSVHEGPHQFRMNYVPAPLHAGMTITIEPGIYIAGSHGARTENTMLIVDDGCTDCGSWLRMEPLTLCPIDTRPIVLSMLAPDEVDYLNKYHARVRAVLLPLLDSEADRRWLLRATEAIA